MRFALTSGLVALTLAGAAATGAAAQTPAQIADRADVRCLMVLQVIGRDPNQQANARAGVYYYLGRLNARGPTARLDALMLSESKTINSAAIVQSELSRCGSELTQRTSEFQALTQKLAAQTRPPGAAAPPPKK